MVNTTQLLGGLGVAAVGAYMWMQHEKNKNVVDKASDRVEKARYDARSFDPTRTEGQKMADSAASTYYDVKSKAQEKTKP